MGKVGKRGKVSFCGTALSPGFADKTAPMAASAAENEQGVLRFRKTKGTGTISIGNKVCPLSFCPLSFSSRME
jgi:hypothetical protein